jgi:hypothetical protein
VPAKGSLDLFGMEVDDLMTLTKRGVTVSEDDIILAPGQIVPPPGELSKRTSPSCVSRPLAVRAPFRADVPIHAEKLHDLIARAEYSRIVVSAQQSYTRCFLHLLDDRQKVLFPIDDFVHPFIAANKVKDVFGIHTR